MFFAFDFDALGLESVSLAPVVLVVCDLKELFGVTLGGGGRGGGADLFRCPVLLSDSPFFSFFWITRSCLQREKRGGQRRERKEGGREGKVHFSLRMPQAVLKP